jgi:hypothetical protein
LKRRALLAISIFALAALPFAPAQAEDSVRISQSSALIGEHLSVELRVVAPADATVELTPGTPSWADVELVGVDVITRSAQGDSVEWFFAARVAPFSPGEIAFAPSVAIVRGSEATPRVLPVVALNVVPTLAPDADLVLSPLPPPLAIRGAESPLLKPGIAAGVFGAAALLALVLFFLGRALLRVLRRETPIEAAPVMPSTLEGAAALLDSDPVGAYRLMSAVVKSELARRYGVRATALTSRELRRKLESGSDRWEARLVGGLLEECDSVIYAGYRPAPERRQADLTMAREIVEVSA